MDNVRIIADLGDQSARIRTSPNRGLERTVDLSACSSATLTFDRRRSSIDAGEGVRAYATDGVSTIQLWDSGSGTDAAYAQILNLNIPLLTATTRIQFISYSFNQANDIFYFDNV